MVEIFDNTPTGPLDLSKLDTDRILNHVGLIMDGNGRWANARDLPRTAGHAAGETALFNTIDGALAVGVKWLSAYTFSTENWTRDPEEVQFLMWFNEDLLLRRRDALHEKGVRMYFAGDLEDPRIPDRNRVHMADAQELTKDNDALHMVFAFNYGGRDEIVRAVRTLAGEVAAGERDVDSIDDDAIAANLWVPDMPDPDLIVRTSGEVRLSNFLLWGSAYAEFVFTETRWPEFGAQPLINAIVEYQTRARRFGKA